MEERQKIVQYKLGNSKSCIKFWTISELLADKDDSTVVVYCIQSRVKNVPTCTWQGLNGNNQRRK